MKDLTLNQIEEVSGGVSDDAAYGASIAVSVAFTAALLVPGIGTGVALAFWGGSLFASGMAMSYA